MAEVKIPEKGNRGHSKEWHADVGCPCGGRPQRISKRLEARRTMAVDKNGTHKHHMPGSQNRKK